MLCALNEKGEMISLVKKTDIQKREQNFFCPVCHKRVILKAGSSRRWHFAHYYDTNCGTTESESEYHLKGKEWLYEWLIDQGFRAELETYFPEIKQRADLYVTSPMNTPIEFQCSTIRDDLFFTRTLNYMILNKKPLWILGGNRLERLGTYTFKLNRMEWMALNETSFTPNEPFLLYFCPKTDLFALITKIIPYSTTKIIGDLQFFPRKQLKYISLFKDKHLYKQNNIHIKQWLQMKTNWRVYPYRRRTTAFRYVSRMLQSLNKDIPLFPREAGLPSHYLFWIETPPHLWQSWLLIQCIMPLSNEHTIHFREVYAQFKRLVEMRVFTIRTLPLIEKSHYSFAIMNYLVLLCKIGILTRVGKSTFKKNTQIQIPNTLDTALQMDKQVQLYFKTEKMI